MSHIETLIMNEIRKTLENLERSGVGFVTDEVNGKLFYDIDGTVIVVKISTEEKGE